ncbi:MAG: fumarylacetoacetase, partial [Acetobacteraceae bacterium]
MIDETHDPARKSWVPGADGHADFPIQNLPLGVFSASGGRPRGGIAIGNWILDLGAALEVGLFDGLGRDAAEAAAGPALNPLLTMGAEARRALRRQVSALLGADSPARSRAEPISNRLLHRSPHCTLHLPATIGDYTDFFAGIQHATNTGRLFRPDNPLLPNYKYVPVAYHGRASSVRPSGTDVQRPSGQRRPAGESEPTFGPARSLDYELELGIWIGPGNELGEPIPIGQAHAHIAGCCLLNDWSARDIQAWEYQPLGPFLAKSFCTSVSPWIITAEALAPFRSAQPRRPPGDPAPLPYLHDVADQESGALDSDCDVLLLT